MATPQLPAQIAVGTSRVAIPFDSVTNPRGFQLLIDADNSGQVYFGGATVTTATGFRLSPGAGYFFSRERIEQMGGAVYLVADSGGQKAYADPQ